MMRRALYAALALWLAALPACAQQVIGTPPGSRANASSASANPTGTTSATNVMMGLAGAITPRTTGSVLLTFAGGCASTVLNDRGTVTISYGTGGAPSNAAAVTGTQVNPIILFVAASVTNGGYAPCSGTAIVTGLVVGTAYWFDVAMLRAAGTGTVSITQVVMTAHEI